MISGAKMKQTIARDHDRGDRDHEPPAELGQVLDDRHPAVGVRSLPRLLRAVRLLARRRLAHRRRVRRLGG